MILKNKRIYTDEERRILWEEYREDRTNSSVFNNLLESYLPLVEVIAAKTKAILPSYVEIGDLVNDGFFGLVDAVEKFDESKGYKFETYATNRIRGEINDRLRDYDWVSRYARVKFKLVQQTEQFLIETLQREPTSKDIADRLGWPVSEVLKYQAAFANSFTSNIDEYMSDSTHETFSLSEIIADETLPSPSFALELDELKDSLSVALFSLEEYESVILYLYIYEDMNFTQIAEILNDKPHRISLVYDKALKKLQERFGVL